MHRFQSILMPVAAAEAAVAPFRRDGDWSSLHGVPAHITVAGPWPLSTRLPTRDLGRLAATARGIRFALATVGTLGDAISLFPEDEAQLPRLRALVLDAVGTPDAVDESWRLHLTVCRGATRERVTAVEAMLGVQLPIDCEADGLLLARMEDSRVTVRPL